MSSNSDFHDIYNLVDKEDVIESARVMAWDADPDFGANFDKELESNYIACNEILNEVYEKHEDGPDMDALNELRRSLRRDIISSFVHTVRDNMGVEK